ncbi:VanW family protein [Candidatus Peregrinibacteria bacterium]|nr:VanW family protein [Candidatus Peregrinibacteria bacterium]
MFGAHMAASKADPLERKAERMQERLHRHFGRSPSLANLRSALQERQRLFATLLTATFAVDAAPSSIVIPEPWTVSLQQHPLWLTFDLTGNTARFFVDVHRMQADLTTFGMPGVVRSVHGSILTFAEEGKVLRATTDGVVPVNGLTYDAANVAFLLASALSQGHSSAVSVPLEYEEGRMYLPQEEEQKHLVLLSSGRSNYAGSPWGREKNIEKAVREHLNNIFIPPGATFSFNATLGGPVTQSRGWYEALGIFGNGDELRPTPGGGLCQTSTTVYRAILAGGFPVIERRSHSLYVGYYKKYGVGLDATIFPGSQDLVFANDTSSYLLMQATTEGKDVIVNIYGVPDGRQVALDGPYFQTTAPDDLLVNGRKLREKEIAWIQRIVRPSGEEQTNIIVSSYKKGIPHQILVEQLKAEKNV